MTQNRHQTHVFITFFVQIGTKREEKWKENAVLNTQTNKEIYLKKNEIKSNELYDGHERMQKMPLGWTIRLSDKRMQFTFNDVLDTKNDGSMSHFRWWRNFYLCRQTLENFLFLFWVWAHWQQIPLQNSRTQSAERNHHNSY